MHPEKRNRRSTVRLPKRTGGTAFALTIACLPLLIAGCLSPITGLPLVEPGAEGPTDPIAAAATLAENPMNQVPADQAENPIDRVPMDQVPSAVGNPQSSQSSSKFDAEEGLTIEQVLQHALHHHPALRARHHEVEVARSKLIAARMLPNPTLILKTDSPVHESDPTDLTTRVMFPIPDLRKLRRRKEVASVGIYRAQLALTREEELVLLDAAHAAIDVLYLQELVLLHGRLGEIAASEIEFQENRYSAGLSTFADPMETRLDATGYQLTYLNTVAQLKAARLRLSRAMGLPRPVLVRMQGKVVVKPTPFVPLETILAVASKADPELAAARAAITESRRKLALAHAGATLDLEMGPIYKAALGEADDNIGARLDIDLPLFDRNQDTICERAAQIQVDRARLDVTKLSTLNEVATAYHDLLGIEASLQYYQAQMQKYRLGDDIRRTHEDLQAAGIGANQISDLLRKLVEARVKHLNLRYRHNLLRMRLEQLLGRPLEDLEKGPDPSANEELGHRLRGGR